jgi:hypothetical protein
MVSDHRKKSIRVHASYPVRDTWLRTRHALFMGYLPPKSRFSINNQIATALFYSANILRGAIG